MVFASVASGRWPFRLGSVIPSTRSLPRASAARNAVSVESMPPLRIHDDAVGLGVVDCAFDVCHDGGPKFGECILFGDERGRCPVPIITAAFFRCRNHMADSLLDFGTNGRYLAVFLKQLVCQFTPPTRTARWATPRELPRWVTTGWRRCRLPARKGCFSAGAVATSNERFRGRSRSRCRTPTTTARTTQPPRPVAGRPTPCAGRANVIITSSTASSPTGASR